MGVTSEGVVYADATHSTRIWEMDQEQADSINTQLVAMRGKPVANVFTANGVWNKPAGAKKVRVRAKGAGGQGGGVVGAAGGHGEGGYGGAGGWSEKWFDATELAAAITVTVGAAGSGAGAGAAGNPGGNSSFQHTTPVVGGGGGGGAAMTAGAGSSIANGGAGGTAAGGDVNAFGQSGGSGRTLAGVAVLVSVGGDGMLGRGAVPKTAAGVGNSAGQYGAGGGGAFATTVSQAGGPGSAGLVIVETWK